MVLHGVECERAEPIAPEAYRCKWEDRNTLVLAFLRQGCGTRTTEIQGIRDAPGIVGKRHAMVTVESYGCV